MASWAVTGTLDAPKVRGTVEVEDGELRLNDPRLIVSDLDGALLLTGDTLMVHELTGDADGGRVEVGGRWSLGGRHRRAARQREPELVGPLVRVVEERAARSAGRSRQPAAARLGGPVQRDARDRHGSTLPHRHSQDG